MDNDIFFAAKILHKLKRLYASSLQWKDFFFTISHLSIGLLVWPLIYLTTGPNGLTEMEDILWLSYFDPKIYFEPSKLPPLMGSDPWQAMCIESPGLLVQGTESLANAPEFCVFCTVPWIPASLSFVAHGQVYFSRVHARHIWQNIKQAIRKAGCYTPHLRDTTPNLDRIQTQNS